MTIESSFHGFLDENRDTKIFNEANLQYFGHNFCQSVHEYSLILEENERQKLELAKKLSKKRKQQKRKTIREIINLNKSNARITRRVEKPANHSDLDSNYKIRSPSKRIYKNFSRADKSAKATPKKLFNADLHQLPNLNSNADSGAKNRNFRLKIREGSFTNL